VPTGVGYFILAFYLPRHYFNSPEEHNTPLSALPLFSQIATISTRESLIFVVAYSMQELSLATAASIAKSQKELGGRYEGPFRA